MTSIKKSRKDIFESFNPQIYNDAVKVLKDEDIRVVNFEVTRLVAKLIKTMYGPKGLNKMIIPVSNETEITQKGYKVIKK